MDPNDVKRGDWVFSNTMNQPCKVLGIIPEETEEGEKIVFKLTNGTSTFLVYNTSVDPLDISDDFLLKNDFQPIKGVDNNTIKYILIEDGRREGCVIEITPYNPPHMGVKFLVSIHTESTHDNGVNRIHNCDIEYVHQLQHAFKICKIKKDFIV